MKRIVSFVALAAAVTLSSLRADTPTSLTAENYDEVKKLVAPTARDFAFEQVDWHLSLPDAINAAAKEDKPILLWLYFGNPTGNC